MREAVKTINAEYQSKLRGTVWQYYEMIDVMYPTAAGTSEVRKPNDASWNPKLFTNTPAMVNVTMESYLAYKYSTWSLDNCQSCHYLATPQAPPDTAASHVPPQVFSYLYRRATPSRPVDSSGTCSPRRSSRHPDRITGLDANRATPPPNRAFGTIGGEAPQPNVKPHKRPE